MNAGTALQAVVFTPVDTGYYASVFLDVSVTVLKADQTIDFPEIGNQLTTNVVALAATDGTPAAIRAGRVTNEPPPARAFIAPARRPAPASSRVVSSMA